MRIKVVSILIWLVLIDPFVLKPLFLLVIALLDKSVLSLLDLCSDGCLLLIILRQGLQKELLVVNFRKTPIKLSDFLQGIENVHLSL